MNIIRKQIDKLKPNFEKGKKLYFLHSTFNAFETFFFVPNATTKSGTHIKDAIDMKRTMITVVIALIPCFLFGIYNTGLQHFIATNQIYNFWQIILYGLKLVIPLYLVTYIVGLGIEFASAQIKKQEVSEGFLVTGFIIPLIVPADIPLWTLALATAFAVIIGKEVFGGSGMNIFNPALLARAFLFFAYPKWMSGDKVWVSGLMSGENIPDAYSGATMLAQAANGAKEFVNGLGEKITYSDIIIGTIPGCVGETSKIAIILGALLLLYTGIASWRIMISTLAGASIMGLIFNLLAINPVMEVAWYQHLIMGGFAFGLVFMATDPVTAAQTNIGKYFYGLGIGALVIIIRVLNPAYPEGMMLAILLMNVFAPLIDHCVIQVNIIKRKNRLKK